MATLEKVDESYRSWIRQIIERYRSSQIKAAVKVNREMLHFYWSLGEDIVRMKLESVYGDSILDRISSDLKQQFPSVKGFSVTNLNYMKRFYLMYNRAVENHPQLVGNSSEGQLGTYVVAVDEILRSEQDNQTIGLLICKTKDEVLAQYALKASNQPIGVSEYTLNQILPEQLKDALPSVKDLQEHLEK